MLDFVKQSGGSNLGTVPKKGLFPTDMKRGLSELALEMAAYMTNDDSFPLTQRDYETLKKVLGTGNIEHAMGMLDEKALERVKASVLLARAHVAQWWSETEVFGLLAMYNALDTGDYRTCAQIIFD